MMTLVSLLQDLQASPPHEAVADTLAATTALPPADDRLGTLGRDVGDVIHLIMEGQWSQLQTMATEGISYLVVQLLPNLMVALLVWLILYLLYRVVKKAFHKALDRSKHVDAGLQNLVIKSFTVTAWVFMVVMVLAQFGINVTALLAGLSIAGIAVGFAAKDSLENFISGVAILLDRPFRIGDYVDIDGLYGRVEEITLRSTRLRTQNNLIMVMPNIQMVNQMLLNHSQLGIVRIEVPFGIAYKEFPLEARKVVMALTAGDDRLHPDYPPNVVVAGLNDSSVDMVLRLFIRDPKLEVPVRYEYIERVREALRDADIEIPFPHLQLFIDEAKALENSTLFPPAAAAH